MLNTFFIIVIMKRIIKILILFITLESSALKNNINNYQNTFIIV